MGVGCVVKVAVATGFSASGLLVAEGSQVVDVVSGDVGAGCCLEGVAQAEQ